MPMTFLESKKEEYRIPLSDVSGALPDILCESPKDWGNEGLSEGDPWTF